MSQYKNSPVTPANRMELPLTIMEQKAVLDARKELVEGLTQAGLLDRFNDASKEQMCMVIAAVWRGLRRSMQEQSQLNDEIPF
jgi:hypothetical protein